MNFIKGTAPLISLAILVGSAVVSPTEAQSLKKRIARPVTPSAPPASEFGAESLDVKNLKEKYWAGGEEAELGVVQNRTFTKAKKFQIGGVFGSTIYDPFLSIVDYGFTAGYHLSETLYFGVIGLSHLTSDSSALEYLRTKNSTAQTNIPFHFIGAESNFSLLYGKLSILGKSIIYYDLHLTGLLGLTKTESGSYFTPGIGIGQRFYINRNFSIRADYRMLLYRETLLEKVVTPTLGQSIGQRTAISNSISIGLDFMFGVGK